MLKSPPMYPTPMTPEDIIGRSNMSLFKKFYSIASSSTNDGEYPDKRLNKEIGVEDRKAIAETLQHLRDHGFYPVYIDKNGYIKWGVMVKGASQIKMEKGLPELINLPEKKLQEMARNGYLMVVKSVEINDPGFNDRVYVDATER